MVRHTDATDTENPKNTPTSGRGLVARVVDTIRVLLTDPPHEPGQTPVGPGALGLEWK